MWRSKDSRFGTDFAGVVEAIGSENTWFKPGDEVFGIAPGAFTEYATPREGMTALELPSISFDQAAAVPVAGTTAVQGLRDKGRMRSGQRVLVNGASGCVDTFTVQIAKSYGTEVATVRGTGKMDQARSIGADRVVGYTKEGFAKNGQRYDLIRDVACGRSSLACGRALRPSGGCRVCFIVGFVFSGLPVNLVLGPLASRDGKRIGFMGMAEVTSQDFGLSVRAPWGREGGACD